MACHMTGILKPVRTIERTHLLSVKFSHCPTKEGQSYPPTPPTPPPTPTGMSGLGKTGSGKGWLSELCGRRGKFRGGELFGVTTPLEEILSVT